MRRGEREYILMKNFRAEEPEPEGAAFFWPLGALAA